MVWHDIAHTNLGRLRTNSMVANMKDYTDKAWIVIVLVCIAFWLIGCGTVTTTEYEATTHPVPVEDPILELLIKLGEVEEQ